MTTHRVSGLHAVFSLPGTYENFQKLIGADRVHRALIDGLNVEPGQRVLDLGCGTGFTLDFLPDGVDYVGVDLSPEYVAQAQARYGERGRFYCRRFDEHFTLEEDGFDRVMAIGLLHHLDDASAAHVFSLARSVLKPGGVLGTIDPCYTEGQSPLARFIIRQDRGVAVRTVEGYQALAQPAFETVDSEVHHRLLRYPFSHLIMTCR